MSRLPLSFIALTLWGLLILGHAVTTPRQPRSQRFAAAASAAQIALAPHSEPTKAVTVIPARGLDLSDAKPARVPDTLFDALIQPFVSEALKRREERRRSDPTFDQRIDRGLNASRVNFLLFGYGETHEPPATERAIIGSYTLVSYDYRTGRADLVSLTHDIRGPEIERALSQRGQPSPAVRIDQAYPVGGFALMRQVLEDATGLSVDFQIVFKDVVIQDLIDQVFGDVQVDVPAEFRVQPFYLEGKKYPRGVFPKGPQKLNGRQVIQFIKTVPAVAGTYAKSLEHNARKHLVFQALLDALNQHASERGFWLKSATFLTREIAGGSVTFDFDPVPLTINNIGDALAGLNGLARRGATMPAIKATLYVVDPAHGDGGVQWVNANAAVNPLTQRDIRNGVYPSLDMEIPINANPYGDLATEYWQSVRSLVKKSLTDQHATHVGSEHDPTNQSARTFETGRRVRRVTCLPR